MTATILPEIVQPPFGLGNLMCTQWLAIQGLSGQTTTEDLLEYLMMRALSYFGCGSA